MHFERTDGGAVVQPWTILLFTEKSTGNACCRSRAADEIRIIGMWPLWISDTPETGIPRFLAAGFDNLRD
jgi:hypothetical protein